MSPFNLAESVEDPVVREVLQDVITGLSSHVVPWCKTYATVVGPARTLSYEDLSNILRAAVRIELESLLRDGDVAFRDAVRLRGEALRQRGVDFDEVVAIEGVMQATFRECCIARNGDTLTLGPRLQALDAVTHARVAVLAEAYIGGAARERPPAAAARPDAGPAYWNRIEGLVGRSPPMRALFDRIRGAAMGRGTAFVVGESGTGKEAVSRAVHDLGDPPGSPFVAVNCAALTRELLESELFGHLRGSFSGAVSDSPGLVRAANGGALFLDEVTEMPAEAQAKLLRVVQERTVRPVGSIAEVPVDVRIVASTNRDPRRAVAEGHLRADLFHRLNVQTICVPPLRERLDDVPALVEHFVETHAPRYRRNVRGVEPGALDAMRAYAWPGNVRELSNAVESALAFGRDDVLRLRDLPEEVRDAGLVATDGARAPAETPATPPIPTFQAAQRDLVQRALDRCRGNKSEAARLLGISRKRLYATMRRFGIRDEGAFPDDPDGSNRADSSGSN